MLKNQKCLSACYRNFFGILVVKFRAVLNIYWISVNRPQWNNPNPSKPQFPSLENRANPPILQGDYEG